MYDFTKKLASILADKKEKSNFKKNISRMKKRIDKYFMYVSKNDDDEENTNVIEI